MSLPSTQERHTIPTADPEVQTVGIVIPVYQGEKTLSALLREIEPLTHHQMTSKGTAFRVTEVVLVHDGAIDRSDLVMQELAAQYAFVSLIWLSRNYGQHPATLAGMASTTAEWVVTMDEDGQHNPADIGSLLDTGMAGAQLVYGKPLNPPPHGMFRNMMSGMTKWMFTTILQNKSFGRFYSYRLLRGEIARSLAAYCGTSVFLDVALSWVVANVAQCPVTVRNLTDRPSGYSLRNLVRHFLRLMLTSGTKPLRFIALLGVFSFVIAGLITIYALWSKFTSDIPLRGWTSMVIVVSFFSGCILFSLGIIAEYVAVALNTIMGRPLYLVSSRPVQKKQ